MAANSDFVILFPRPSRRDHECRPHNTTRFVRSTANLPPPSWQPHGIHPCQNKIMDRVAGAHVAVFSSNLLVVSNHRTYFLSAFTATHTQARLPLASLQWAVSLRYFIHDRCTFYIDSVSFEPRNPHNGTSPSRYATPLYTACVPFEPQAPPKPPNPCKCTAHNHPQQHRSSSKRRPLQALPTMSCTGCE